MKKRNRMLALLLAGVLACGLLAGCGSKGADDASGSKGADAQETEKTDDQDSAKAESEDTEETKGGDAEETEGEDAEETKGDDGQDAAEEETAGVREVDALSLTLTTSFSETETSGQIIKHFIEYLEQNSNGAVKVDVYWGGTLASNKEELKFVGSAAADMTVVGQSSYTDVLPLMNFPSLVPGGYQKAVDFMNEMIFENETTAPLIQAQVEAQNVKMLGSVATGSNTFVSKSEAASLKDLTGMKLGVGMNQSAFESLGFNGVVTVMPWDYYDNLSRGIADVGYMSAAALVSMSVQEVTPYFLMDGNYAAGNFMTINLDRWNGMSADQQALFEEAMEDTASYSIELIQQMDEEAEEAIVAAGGKVSVLSDEETKAVQEALFATGVTDCRSFAEAAGCKEDMETILKAVSEYLGVAME